MAEGHEKMDQEEIDKIRKQYDEILQDGLKNTKRNIRGQRRNMSRNTSSCFEGCRYIRKII